jgi:hypothetical protein
VGQFKTRKAHQILSRILWLGANGCTFSFNLDEETAKLKTDVTLWKESYASHAADSIPSSPVWVRTDTESEALLRVPLSEVLATAQALSVYHEDFFVEHDPFAGLAATRPVRALAALEAAEDGYDVKWAWEAFLNAQARNDDKPRFMLVIAARLLRLDDADFIKLVRPIADWLLRVSKILLVDGRESFERLWGSLVTNLKANYKVGESTTITGNKQHHWATEALNSPAGYMAQALFNDLPSGEGRIGLPETWRARADELLSIPGNPRRHALAIFCHNLTYLFHIDPEWAERSLVSAIAGSNEDDAAAFWAGFFWGARPPQEGLYLKMKPALLALARHASELRREHGQILAGILLIGWNGKVTETGQRAISNEEMRAVLVEADDEFRSQVIWHLDTWSREKGGQWANDALTFLKEVWPKQIVAKTSAVSARLAKLAFSHDEDFPEYVDAIIPLVIPISQLYATLPSLQISGEQNIVEKFPQKTLELLTAILSDDARKWPYDTDDVLRRIGIADASLLNDPRLMKLNKILNAR